VTHDHDAAPWRFLFVAKVSPHDRRDAEEPGKTSRAIGSLQRLGLPGAGELDGYGSDDLHALQCSLCRAPSQELQRRDRDDCGRRALLGLDAGESIEPLGIGVWQWPQAGRGEHCDNGGRGANTEGEKRDGEHRVQAVAGGVTVW
jgi:hypothetical protein